MDVSGASNQRLKAAVELFLEGQTLARDGVVFSRDGRALNVYSYSAWEPENTTPEHAQERIAHARAVLATLMSLSPEFRAVAESLRIEHSFCHDYGKGAVVLATEVDGRFEWRGR